MRSRFPFSAAAPLALALALASLTPASAAQQPATTAAPAATFPLTGLPVDDPVVDAIFAESAANSRVMEWLDELSEGIGPRLTSSRNLTEACQWAAERFRGFGIENVRIEEWGTFPVGYDRHHWEGRLVAPIKKRLEFGFSSWTAGTDGPVRGPVLAAPASSEELVEMQGKLRGAWVLLGATRPRYDSEDTDFRSQLGRFLDSEGIAGTLRPGRGELVLTGGNYRIDPADLPTRVELNLLSDHAREIFRLLEAGEAVEAEFDVAVTFTPGPIPLYNVIAEIPGTEKSEEIVIVGGHIDSWDGARGAQDNGTGCATTLEAARLLMAAGAKPKRTIRFMLWSGEEQGLLGSRAYLEAHPEELPRISAVLVHDGGTNAASGVATTDVLRDVFEEAFAPLIEGTKDNELEELRFKLNMVGSLPVGVGSDHDSYLRAGVPGFFWNQRGRTSYTYIHHTQHDVIGEVVPEYQEHTARVAAIGAWRIANLPEMLPRDGIGAGGGSRPPRRVIGLQFDPENALVVAEVSTGGMAEKAGLRKGDKLIRIDEAKLESLTDLRSSLRGGATQRKITIDRKGEKIAYLFDWDKSTATQIE
ncbi:MAG TPA: M20/M25/M40 family metallo-hydrolase [Planctomycetota bacterium]